MSRSVIVLLLCMALGACKFDEPQVLDPASILGCYSANQAPSILIAEDTMKAQGVARILQYRYAFRKVGPMIEVPLMAEVQRGKFALVPSEVHFYRVIFDDSGPLIRVAFGPTGELVDYRRTMPRACSF